ncbi:MAG: HD domain-containing protein [Oscillospiraceae bacterium]|nr:HD domain-containing protein [Oscillospiraceae bacterium]MCI7499110.1 HD domain-containing protein [Oscillospiraceae bacterium]MDD7279623.1 HD domain-containing protein [Oscillospiraceae bacterium]MDY2863182.1 HD domain-containing protein [Oscillospiraceae bacterium]
MNICDVIESAVSYDRGDPKRINHFMKVYAFAGLIGRKEGISGRELDILEAAAVLHDIGIHNAEMLHGSSDGKYQELEGPGVAADILSALGADDEFIGKVCNMVGRHHTYTGIDSLSLQILIEADFLVNIFEDGMSDGAISSVKEKIFRTAEGTRIIEEMYEEKYHQL